jgi:hypothetical protein
MVLRLDEQVAKAQHDIRLKEIQQQDPDGLGQDLTPAEYRDARWITDMWRAHCEPGMHLRAIFYRLLSKQIMMPPGKRQHDRPGRPTFDPIKDVIALPLENTFWHWSQVLQASVIARYAGMVHPHELEEHRSPEPRRYFYPREPPVPSLNWIEETIPHPQVIGYDYDGMHGADQGYQVEVWCEKSSMDHILEPLCAKLYVNYQACQGYSSITRVNQLLRRARKGRPIRLFAITDFDGAGANMPYALVDQIRKLITRYPEVSVKVVQLALTEQQVRDFKLPYNMIDPDKKEDSGLKKVFTEKYPDLGPVELDALEAVAPGVLERLVREAVEPFIDTQLAIRLAKAGDDARTAVEDAWSEEIEDEVHALDEADDHLERGEHALHARANRFTTPIEKRKSRLQGLAPTDRRLRAHQRAVARINSRYARLIAPYERAILRLRARCNRHTASHYGLLRKRQTRLDLRRQFRLDRLDAAIASIRDRYGRLIGLLFTKVDAERAAVHERIAVKRDEFQAPLIERPSPETVEDSDTPWLLDLHSDR